MTRSEKLGALRRLQDRVDTARRELAVSGQGELLYMAPLNPADNDIVVVEADGFGEAEVSIVDGQYPVDYITKYCRLFATENQACDAAMQIVEKGASPSLVLGLAC